MEISDSNNTPIRGSSMVSGKGRLRLLILNIHRFASKVSPSGKLRLRRFLSTSSMALGNIRPIVQNSRPLSHLLRQSLCPPWNTGHIY